MNDLFNGTLYNIDTNFNAETLKLARTYLGVNQKQMANILDISQAYISAIEMGRKPLSDSIIKNLEQQFGKTFFKQKIREPLLKVHYRASATVAKKYTDLFESRLRIIANNIAKMLDHLEIPLNNIPKKDLQDFQLNATYLASEIRQYFNLGMNPIGDIVRLLEKNGVIIHFFDYDFISNQNKNFDGVSFYISGVPVILINNNIQGARKIFTIAHELGHLIMHNHNDIIISNDRDIEKEANEFASEFLAPNRAFRGEFVRLNVAKLFELKAYWNISASALLYKAKKLSLSDAQFRRLITSMAPYRKEEPNDLWVNSPILLDRMLKSCIDELGGLENVLNDLGISHYLYENIYKTIIPKNQKHKLKILV